MIKCGVDIVHNPRFDNYLTDVNFVGRVFHNSELKERKKLRGVFALKEAVMKVLGKKVEWKKIEVKYDKTKPKITLSIDIVPKGYKGIDVSVSHDGDYTIAFVVMELKD